MNVANWTYAGSSIAGFILEFPNNGSSVGSFIETVGPDARSGSTVVDAAVNWIERQPTDKPWMATVSFA